MSARFANWLTDMISRGDWTYVSLGRAVGVSDETVRRWATGDDLPRGRHIVPLARALGVSPALAVSHFEGATPLDEMESFYAALPDNLTDEERKSILAFIRARRAQQ